MLTIFAGLATGVGSLMAFYTKQTNKKFLSAALGFSAGVMIYVSMVEIFVKARASLEAVHGPERGYLYTTLAFFLGIFIIAVIDKLLPTAEKYGEHHIAIYGLISGMMVMAASLVLFGGA